MIHEALTEVFVAIIGAIRLFFGLLRNQIKAFREFLQ